MLTNHQQQMIQNSHLLNQPPQSFSYSPIPSSQHVVNNIIPLEPVKQATLPPSFPSSTTSVVPETIENSHTSISPSPTPSSISHISEAVQPSVPSDAQQPSVRFDQWDIRNLSFLLIRYPVVYNNWKYF